MLTQEQQDARQAYFEKVEREEATAEATAAAEAKAKRKQIESLAVALLGVMSQFRCALGEACSAVGVAPDLKERVLARVKELQAG